MFPEARDEHRWLMKLIGDWTYESRCPPAPGEPEMTFRGRELVRPFGPCWIVGEGEGEMPGCTGRMRITLGYDPGRGRFVGSWIGTMMANMFVYEGSLDPSRRILGLDCEGPSFLPGGGMARYRDVIEILSPSERTLTAHMLMPDGNWTEIMSAHYRRAP